MPTFRRHLCLALTTLSFLSLSGCTTLPATTAPQNNPVGWDARAQALSNLQTWDLKAMIAIRANNSADSASLTWQQAKQHYVINLFGPLGANAYTLKGSPNKVTLENAKGQTFSAPTPEALVAQQTGWRLPVSYLQYWIRGLPVPHVPAGQQFDAFHHLTVLTQAGWQVQFLRYTSAKTLDLPSKIVIHSADLDVKIIVSDWALQ